MNKRQEARLSMYHAVISHCNANLPIITAIPAFITIFDAFRIKVAVIASTIQKEVQIIKGIAKDKNVKREALFLQAANIASIVYAYAVSQKDHTLKGEVNFTKSKLRDMRDRELVAASRNILNTASTNSIALAAYGITAVTLTSFTDIINNYAAVVAAPRNAIALRKAYLTDLQTHFKECSFKLNDQLDKIAVQFKSTNPEFYIAYKNNRIIVDAPTTKKQDTIADTTPT